eukprot:1736220-Amphidinium_carterae.1
MHNQGLHNQRGFVGAPVFAALCNIVVRKMTSTTAVLNRLVRAELLVNVQMRRHFHWHQNCLWLEERRAANVTWLCASLLDMEDLQKADLLGTEQARQRFVEGSSALHGIKAC